MGKSRAAVLTAFDPSFANVFAPGSRLSAMPAGWDIGGGDSAGWGRGIAALNWIEAERGVAFSDAAHHRRLLWVPGRDPELIAPTDGAIMGAAIDARGRFIGGDWAGRRIVAEQLGEATAILAEGFAGRRFNRPGSVCNGPDDSLYFIDQKQPFPPSDPATDQAESGVYRIDRTGSVTRLAIAIPFPGGIAFDPHRSRLVISEPRLRRVHAFPVTAHGEVGVGAVIATLEGDGKGAPHGLAIDTQGHIFIGGPGGLWVLDAAGTPLGILHLTASRVIGVAIGGGNLFIATPVGLGTIGLTPGEASNGPPATPAIVRQPLGFTQGIERHDPAFDSIVAADTVITNHAMGGFFEDLGGGEDERYSRSLEGLIWDSRERCLKFSDIGNSRRMRLCVETGDISVANQPTGHTNGATYDADGNILSCEHSKRRVSRLLADGTRVTVVDRTGDGCRLNHPNDIVVRSDGNIYFTDPWWDFGAGETCETGGTTSWHLRPDGSLSAFGGDWLVCNGLALSVDERRLFVNDSLKKHIRVFDIAPDGSVDSASDRIFCELPGTEHGTPDGMKLDLAGNVYCGGPGGLWVFDPAGKHLGTIRHGACQTNNLCFGGDDWRTLFIGSWTTIHSLPVLIPGVRTLDAR